MRDGLTIQMIVKNEDRWVWYAISSVLKYADKFLIYDTGSTDGTVEIIKSFSDKRIIFEQKGVVNAQEMTELRQEQLNKTETDWFLLVDGDEVWPDKSIKKLQGIIKNDPDKNGIVVRVRMCIDDIKHYQDEKAGHYAIASKKGHLNIRAYRKNNVYSWQGIYPNEAFSDQLHIPIQNKVKELVFLEEYYWHLRHLPRSTKFKNKIRKLEFGKEVKSADLPEVFYKKRPVFVPSPWVKLSFTEQILAAIATPLRSIKRTIE